MMPQNQKNLNERQQEAVDHGDGPILIAAGAGSGKTKTLTTRLARLIERGIRPENIVAITFTNEAAKEMADRVSANPLEPKVDSEVAIAEAQYGALIAYAADPSGLALKLDKDRREELTKLEQGEDGTFAWSKVPGQVVWPIQDAPLDNAAARVKVGDLDLDVRGGEVKAYRYKLIPVFSDAIVPDAEMAASIRLMYGWMDPWCWCMSSSSSRITTFSAPMEALIGNRRWI
mgnify:CR=1 FL=1